MFLPEKQTFVLLFCVVLIVLLVLPTSEAGLLQHLKDRFSQRGKTSGAQNRNRGPANQNHPSSNRNRGSVFTSTKNHGTPARNAQPGGPKSSKKPLSWRFPSYKWNGWRTLSSVVRHRTFPGRRYTVGVRRTLDVAWTTRQELWSQLRSRGGKLEEDDVKFFKQIESNDREPVHKPGEVKREDERISDQIRAMMENAQLVEDDDEEDDGSDGFYRKKRSVNVELRIPKIKGVNLDVVPQLNPRGKMRAGFATNSHSCNYIRGVPQDLLVGVEIPEKYAKYTEAYNIPVLGTANVTDVGMKRACYIVRALFADRYDMRLGFFKFHGRVILIADNEQTTDHYPGLKPEEYDASTRGLGATIHMPWSSAGDDNMRCCCDDRYIKQDIMIHELAHGIQQLAATFLVPGFSKRLKNIYASAMEKGLWANTYAATNKVEYYAMGSAFYFNSYDRDDYIFGNFTVTGRESLKEYDPDLYHLLFTIHPCQNDIIQRCDWRSENDCSMDHVTKLTNYSDFQKPGCPVKQQIKQKTVEECIQLGCFHLAHAIAMLGDTCLVLNCRSTDEIAIHPVSGFGRSYEIYSIDRHPVIDLKKEEAHQLKMDCTRPPSKGRCRFNRTIHPIEEYGPGVSTSEACKSVGGCFTRGKCHYPLQDCTDTHNLCPDMALRGDCDRNKPWMWVHCALSCATCGKLKTLDLTIMQQLCQDKEVYCQPWQERGECVSPSSKDYMEYACPLSCGKCEAVEDPYAWANTEDKTGAVNIVL